jgi:PPOX class probable F420-dependent enzyme
VGKNLRSQIEMTDEETARFLEQSRTCTMATVGPGGMPHLVAMWYALLNGQVWLESKTKAQKIVNLRRDDRLSVMIEAGNTYETLRGVSLEGRGVIVEDPDKIWRVGVNVWERYHGPYEDEFKPFVEAMLHKRVAVRLEVERSRTWDHRKLGMRATELGGTTGRYIDGPGLPGPG